MAVFVPLSRPRRQRMGNTRAAGKDGTFGASEQAQRLRPAIDSPFHEAAIEQHSPMSCLFRDQEPSDLL